ncbi:hypothetical protein [Lentzea guizhouensis]|nr:hypothetical protein [Lentzea guizhouensis]
MHEYDLAAVDALQLASLVTPLESFDRRCFVDPPWHEQEDRFAACPAVPGVYGTVAWNRDAVGSVGFGWLDADEVPEGAFSAHVSARSIPPNTSC